RVHTRLGDLGLLLPNPVGRVLALNAYGLCVGGHPVHAKHEVAAELRAWKQVDDLQGISYVAAEREHRKIVRPVDADVMADFSALRFQKSTGVGNADRLGSRPELQRDVPAHRGRHRNLEISPNVLLEARQSHSEIVGSSGHGEHIVSGGGGATLKDGSGVHV